MVIFKTNVKDYKSFTGIHKYDFFHRNHEIKEREYMMGDCFLIKYIFSDCLIYSLNLKAIINRMIEHDIYNIANIN
jgi:hypothetical protein